MDRLVPTSGAAAPVAFDLGDRQIDLGELAEELCDLYYELFPDELERDGETARAWCDHDARYLFAWALEEAGSGALDTVAQVNWLARVLEARNVPIEHFALRVELACAVLERMIPGAVGTRAAARMAQAAESVATGAFRRAPGTL